MAILTIRGLPDSVHKCLKERARQNRRSLNQEVIAELSARIEESTRIEEAKSRMRQAQAEIERLQARHEIALTAEQIRAVIEEGRK